MGAQRLTGLAGSEGLLEPGQLAHGQHRCGCEQHHAVAQAQHPSGALGGGEFADPGRLLRNDAAAPGLPLTLTKPLGVGLLNNRHKQTGEVFAAAVATMTRLNRDAAEAATAAGVRAATDVTGFGLLGHLYKMCRASRVGAVIDRDAVPVIEGAREALRDGFISGGTRRNLEWVRPHLRSASGVTEDELVLLADAQTSGGLLVVGALPGYPVVGHTVSGGGIMVR